MSQRSKQESFPMMYARYRHASAAEKEKLLDELCRVCGSHRKHAIRKLNQPVREPRLRTRSPRSVTYLPQTISILTAVWEAAGYPWSLRLKALTATTAANLLMPTYSAFVTNTTFSSRAGVRTGKTTTPTSNKRIGRMSAKGWVGSAMIVRTRWRR